MVVHDLTLWKEMSLDIFNKILLSMPWRNGIKRIRKLKTRYTDATLFVAISRGKMALEELGFDMYIGVEVDYENNRLNGKVEFYPEYYERV